jgi:hypothetical protein
VTSKKLVVPAIVASVLASAVLLHGQAPATPGAPVVITPPPAPSPVVLPDPHEIPVPEIKTNPDLPTFPGPDALPDRKEMPDFMIMNDGTRVTTPEQWKKRREEMKTMLEYYVTGRAPPPPGNVKGHEVSSELLADGKVKYRLVHLTFGPEEKLSLDIGIYTPTSGPGPFPTLIMPGVVPGAARLPQLPPEQSPGNQDLLLFIGPGQGRGGFGGGRGAGRGAAGATQPAGAQGAAPAGTQPGAFAGGRGGRGRGFGRGRGAGGAGAADPAGTSPAAQGGLAAGGRGAGAGGRGGGLVGPTETTNPAILHGFALVTYSTDACAEDNRLRLPDGSFAFRTTRFFPAYPGYDWGIIRAWGWGASRVIDYLETDASIDKSKLIISGVSRVGKSALFIGAFDDRISMIAPVASSGGGTPAFRFSGPEHGGKEGLTDMMRKYPDQFSPHLHQFWGHIDKLPFDQHWLIALCAPRPFIALEGLSDQNVNANGVRQSILAAKPIYEFLGVPENIGVYWTPRMHGIAQGDWDGMLGMADKVLLKKPVTLDLFHFPDSAYPDGRPAGAP